MQADRFVRAPGPAAFEDGTPDFTNIPAVELGLELLDSVGLDVVHTRVRALVSWLIEEGAGELALGLTRAEIEGCFAAGDSRMTYDDLRRCIDPHEAGAVRVSLGLASNFEDVFAFREYCRTLLA